MITETAIDMRILNVFNILKRKMSKYGKSVSLPPNARKTYNWRYLTNFVNKMDACGLHESFYPQILTAIVEHAHRKKLLKRGIGILLRNDLLEMAIKRLETDENNEDQSNVSVIRAYQFVYDRTEPEQTYAGTLLKRQVRGGYTNLVKWFLAGHLCMDYIVVSRSARIALGSLSEIERSHFPDTRTLLRLRLKFLSRVELIRKLRETLQEDLFEE